MRRNSQPRAGLFEMLSYDEKKQAIIKMASQGFGHQTISSLTAMHPDMIRAIVNDRTLRRDDQ